MPLFIIAVLASACISVVGRCTRTLPCALVKGRAIVVISRLVHFALVDVRLLYAVEDLLESQSSVGVINEDLVGATIRAYGTLGVRVQN